MKTKMVVSLLLLILTFATGVLAMGGHTFSSQLDEDIWNYIDSLPNHQCARLDVIDEFTGRGETATDIDNSLNSLFLAGYLEATQDLQGRITYTAN